MKILLTDIMFPNKFAKWRLVEIQSFIDKFRCDILCLNRIGSYGGVAFDFDWDVLPDYFHLDEYDILIFNSHFNFLNKFNKEINGTEFNNMIKGDYMLRHKSRRGQPLELDTYDSIYHIFLCCYGAFNSRINNYPQRKQYIHLYPGGGYTNPSCMNNIHADVNIIATQEFISRHISRNKFINIYGGPFYYKHEYIIDKSNKKNKLCVCFTSMGNPIEKGAYTYHSIVETYKTAFPDDNVEFISIGNCPSHPYIKALTPMDQLSLSKFYNDAVDVLISLDTGVTINGFPLGVEAMQEGCVVLTTDVHNQNVLNNFNFDDFFIINKDDITDIVNRLKLLTNKDICFEKGKRLQSHVYNLFNYENTMEKIFEFIIKSSM